MNVSKPKGLRPTLWAALAASLALSACATMGETESREQMMAAAQFQRRQADTPAKLAKLQALPQRNFVVKVRNKQNLYLFADAAGCNCLYVGTETAYQNYRQMRLAKQLADEQMAAAVIQQQTEMDWDMWGPWGAWGP